MPSIPVLGTNPVRLCRPPPTATGHSCWTWATSTVASNKVKVYDLQGKALPEGWVLDGQGQPVTDAAVAFDTIHSRQRRPG